jgi:hypothetical protein
MIIRVPVIVVAQIPHVSISAALAGKTCVRLALKWR